MVMHGSLTVYHSTDNKWLSYSYTMVCTFQWIQKIFNTIIHYNTMLFLCKHLRYWRSRRTFQMLSGFCCWLHQHCYKYIVSLHVWAQWSKLTEDEKLKFNSSQDYATAYLSLIYASAHTARKIEGERQIEKQNTLR